MTGDYDIHLDDKFGALTLIDVAAEAAAHEPWFNQTLTTVNDALVRLGVVHGDFHWHKHDGEDEFFLVLEGRLMIDVEGADGVTLEPLQAYTVPRGVVHRTRAPRADDDPDGRARRGRADRRLSAHGAWTDPPRSGLDEPAPAAAHELDASIAVISSPSGRKRRRTISR